MAATETRRDVLRKGAAVAGVAGAAWVAPQVLTLDAAAAASGCVGSPGYFTWNRTAYTQGMRAAPNASGPGSQTQMTTATGWFNHPTYTAPPATTGGTTTGVTLAFKLTNNSFLNTSTTGQGTSSHGVSNANTSAPFKSYRVSKIQNASNVRPPVGSIQTITIEFSQTVRCPTIVLGDIDNVLPAIAGTGCTPPVNTASPAPESFFSDGIDASGFLGLSSRTVNRIAFGAAGSNVTPATGAGTWVPILCNTPNNQNNSQGTIKLQALGSVDRIEISYLTRYQDTNGNGAQHIALGDIDFYY